MRLTLMDTNMIKKLLNYLFLDGYTLMKDVCKDLDRETTICTQILDTTKTKKEL